MKTWQAFTLSAVVAVVVVAIDRSVDRTPPPLPPQIVRVPVAVPVPVAEQPVAASPQVPPQADGVPQAPGPIVAGMNPFTGERVEAADGAPAGQDVETVRRAFMAERADELDLSPEDMELALDVAADFRETAHSWMIARARGEVSEEASLAAIQEAREGLQQELAEGVGEASAVALYDILGLGSGLVPRRGRE